MSRIVEIYDALAALELSYNELSVTSYSIGSMPTNVPNAALPVRILQPADGSAFDFKAVGRLAAMQWQIADLLLAVPPASGLGLEGALRALVTYSGDYAEALRDMRNGGISGSQFTLTAANVEYGLYSWADSQYIGCRWALTFQEILSS